MAETVSELLPCPFCGGAPYVHQVDYCDPPEWAVLCLDGDCGCSHSTEAEAIAAWNRRPPDPAVAELVEGLEWYGENARLCRLIHSEGDAGRHALNEDGGKRARALLAKHAAKP